MYKIDLHLHSNFSDGKLSTLKLAELIKKEKLTHCSLTDHDTVEGIPKIIKHLGKTNVAIIPGVELTSLWKNQEIHILAYGFDIKKVNRVLKNKNQIIYKQKINELKKLKSNFKKSGFAVSANLKTHTNKPAGLTIALDVYNNKKNKDKIGKLSPEEFYYKYQSPGSPCYVKKSGVNLEWIMDKFRDLVDNLILAHPFNNISYLVKPLSIKEIKNIAAKGLDGLEVFHPDLNTTDIEILYNLAMQNNWCFTGGSDFHGKEKENFKLGYINNNFKLKSFKLHGNWN